ncbi:hypothetical protein [Pectinatus frisingensis]|uniref:hypothetical protein n=1 Tax=Pectinatus frisingensis TaxID=865 RepID=UPI0018C4C35F|nr:hypothetical protein [Pectinatus frisingensis]
MKISRDLKKLTTTQTEMAKILGITQQRVSQLIKDGVVVRDKTNAVLVIETLKNYYKVHSDSEASEKDIQLDHERAIHERVKREISEIKLAETRNEVHKTEDIEVMFGSIFTIFKRRMLTIPHKFAKLLIDKSPDEINSMLEKEVKAALVELSSADLSQIGYYGGEGDDTEEDS